MRLLPEFEYHAPTELSDALVLLARHGADARVMAGGTDLLMKMKSGRFTPGHVVALGRIAALREVRFDESGLFIGATARLVDVAALPEARTHYPSLCHAIDHLATPQVRHKASVIGNLCNASPCADTAPPSMAHGGLARIAGPGGTREQPIETFITGPGQVALGPGEIVTGILLPPPLPGLRTVFIKHSPRSRVDISALSVGVALLLDGEVVQRVDIFLGTVAPTPMRAARAEAALRAKALTAETIEAAGAAARDECRPVSDMRASAPYKRQMVYALTKRALRQLGGVA